MKRKFLYFPILGIIFLMVGIRVLLNMTLPDYRSVSKPGINPHSSGEGEVIWRQSATPHIVGETWQKVYFKQGQIIAAERSFQIDLMRLRAEGRLAEVLGEKLVPMDKMHRTLGYSQLVKDAEMSMNDHHRELFLAYARGINDYWKTNRYPSLEHRALGRSPEPWTVRDSILVMLNMYQDMDLFSQYQAEFAATLLELHRPKPLVDFLLTDSDSFDTPFSVDKGKILLPNIPKKEIFDLRSKDQNSITTIFSLPPQDSPFALGSNAFVVGGNLSASRFPIVAGDPHLVLNAPGIWYHAILQTPDTHISGMTLPGVPGVVIGSNEHFAWSFTNAYADAVDLVIADSSTEFTTRKEIIKVKGRADHIHFVKQSKWGPQWFVHNNQSYILQWTALDYSRYLKPSIHLVNEAKNKNELFQALEAWPGPTQSIIYGFKDGTFGQSYIGKFPKRVGFNGRFARNRNEQYYWNNHYSLKELPNIVNPANGYISSANHRMWPTDPQKNISTHTFGFNMLHGSRAKRIANLLAEKEVFTAQDLHSIQHDNRNLLYESYKKWLEHGFQQIKLNRLLTPTEQEVEKLLQTATLVYANTDDPLYAFLFHFRNHIINELIVPLWGLGPIDHMGRKGAVEPFYPFKGIYNHEPVVARLLNERPLHLLSSKYSDYDDFLIKVAVTTALALDPSGKKLGQIKYGDFNYTFHPHPFTLGAKWLSPFLSFPKRPFGGDLFTPKVGAIREDFFFSASMRMVVDLKQPLQGILEIPGGQSGHPHSPYYQDRYEAWYHGLGGKLYPDTRD